MLNWKSTNRPFITFGDYRSKRNRGLKKYRTSIGYISSRIRRICNRFGCKVFVGMYQWERLKNWVINERTLRNKRIK